MLFVYPLSRLVCDVIFVAQKVFRAPDSSLRDETTLVVLLERFGNNWSNLNLSRDHYCVLGDQCKHYRCILNELKRFVQLFFCHFVSVKTDSKTSFNLNFFLRNICFQCHLLTKHTGTLTFTNKVYLGFLKLFYKNKKQKLSMP